MEWLRVRRQIRSASESNSLIFLNVFTHLKPTYRRLLNLVIIQILVIMKF
uniref:Uncharacterized protein n=1 Tax=Anguilla anguilla TaxID=7936 RepID=A0A0E9QY80_ANGAN